jgi:hypothetical protein
MVFCPFPLCLKLTHLATEKIIDLFFFLNGSRQAILTLHLANLVLNYGRLVGQFDAT